MSAGFPWNDQDPNATISPIQKELLEREERFILVVGGTGSGKTVTGALLALIELSKPGKKIAIVGNIYKHVLVEASFLIKGFERLYGKNAAKVTYRDAKNNPEFSIETLWGSTVKGVSLDYQEGTTILGEGFDLVLCAEGDQIDYDTFKRRVLRAADRRLQKQVSGYQYRTGRIIGLSTSSYGEGAISQEYERVLRESKGDESALLVGKVPWAATCYLRRMSFLDNPANDEAVFEARKKAMQDDPDAFLEQYEGGISRRSNLVMSQFSPAKHIIKPLPPEAIRGMRLAVGIDPGGYFGCVLVGADSSNRYYVLGEVNSRPPATVFDNARAVKEMIVETLQPVFNSQGFDIDSHFKDLTRYIDHWEVDANAQYKLEIEELLGVDLGYTKMGIELSIDQMNALFSEDRIYVQDTCEEWIRDIGRYAYSRVNRSQALKPGGTGSHIIDATRYVIIGYLAEVGGPDSPAPVVTFQQAYERERRKSLDWRNDFFRPNNYGILE